MTAMQQINYTLSRAQDCLSVGAILHAQDYLEIALAAARNLPATPKHRALRAHIVSAIEALK